LWIRDLQLVGRGLRRHPLAAGAAAAMLSSGLLAVILTVGLARTLLLRPVSATYGDTVRRIAAIERDGRSVLRFSFRELAPVRERIAAAGTVTSVTLQPILMRVGTTDVQTMAEVADGQYFGITGTSLLMGRGLLSTDDRAGTPPVVVIGEPFWRRRLGASPSILGAHVLLNGRAFTVVGVAGTTGSSSFLGASVDAWVSTAHADPLLDREWRTDPGRRLFTAFVLPTGRVPEVDARLTGAAADLARLLPDVWRDRRLATAPGGMLAGTQRGAVLKLVAVLGGLSALILLTAAANLGGLLLARAAATRRQSAIHLSMGASRAALVRRQLIEGLMLGMAASGMALGLYAWARIALAEVALLPTLALRIDLPFDISLVGLVFAAGATTGLLLAGGPALWGARVDLAGTLSDSHSRAGDGPALTRMRRALVSTQLALMLVLVVGAAIFSRSLEAMAGADLGFAREGLIALDFDLEPSSTAKSELPALAREALGRVAVLPGVTAATMANRAPVDQSTPTLEVRTGSEEGAALGDVTVATVASGYFETVGIPLLAGRAFRPAEIAEAADVAIVNASLARRLWPGESAIGRGLYVTGEHTRVRVVGVAADAKYRTITERSRPHLYRPTPPRLGLTLLARTTADPRATLRSIQQTLDAVGPGLVGFFPRTADDHLVVQLLPTRAAAGSATLLGFLALLLSAVGLYSLVSWFVELRQREIGVRMALGASPADIRALIVGQALRAALPGMIAGGAAAALLSLAATAALFGVAPFDPMAFGAALGAIVLVVAAAAYAPSRRATSVDPATALRD
jgi:putative ABC transport system permease protein